MTPPFSNRTGEPLVDTTQPLRRWFQRGAFDSAKACTEAYEAEWRRAHSITPPVWPPYIRNQVNESLCIASDDPRLGGPEGAWVLWSGTQAAMLPAYGSQWYPINYFDTKDECQHHISVLNARQELTPLELQTPWRCLPDTVKP